MRLPQPIQEGINVDLLVAFQDMLAFFEKHIPGQYWLEAGTCLGFYRNGGPIGHDKDVDFGLLAEAWSPELEAEILKDPKWKLYKRHGDPKIAYEVRFVHENGVRVDWFPFYLNKDFQCRCPDPNHGATRYAAAFLQGGLPDLSDAFLMTFPANLFSNLVEYEWRTLKLPMPSPVEDYLVRRYGNWRFPDRKWDWRNPLCRDDQFTKKLIPNSKL